MLHIPKLQSPWLTLCLWLGAIVLVASWTYRWVERPAIALGRRLSSEPVPVPALALRDAPVGETTS
jgi:peptidoglycan/LPS O-acetylase OafA/YrhL